MRPKRITFLLSLLLIGLILFNGCATMIGAGVDHFLLSDDRVEPEIESIPLDSLQRLETGDRLLVEVVSGEMLKGYYRGMENDTTFVLQVGLQSGGQAKPVGLRPWQLHSIQRYQSAEGGSIGPAARIGLIIDSSFLTLILAFNWMINGNPFTV
ncbi:hypothetical protein KQI63_04520 [bacterium]|nr:hypothetical protein [bacterium]